ncbi:hypothetical protein TUM18999_34140 [Pseudomonas tohonis]|uniref:Uncharacterized protein n=1 Tax=Pseudomonas tohonis TaxID=2725477 RepID=A0A6J4E5K5_9PSED|nr:hypothetical protein TUM18999_34140 [Pseudomonas tohonis]GJN54365.1 hypothetical protein TUM20286_41170 [Pseudomonas tohonis]
MSSPKNFKRDARVNATLERLGDGLSVRGVTSVIKSSLVEGRAARRGPGHFSLCERGENAGEYAQGRPGRDAATA